MGMKNMKDYKPSGSPVVSTQHPEGVVDENEKDTAADRAVGKGKPNAEGVHPDTHPWPEVTPRSPMRLK